MKRVAKVEKVEKVEPTVEKPKKEVSESSKPEEFHVYVGEKFIRTYSTDVHGEEAEKLANQFALKVKGEIK